MADATSAICSLLLVAEEGTASALRGLREVDDLSRIKGLGADLAAQLNGLGVIKFDQIANFSDDDIANVDETLSLNGRIEKENWLRQAQEFVAEAAAAEVPAQEDQKDAKKG